ncbi:MAG: putative glycoside hydrolase, partial [Candidatus Margulisbacteria bacterium]|nr:putative glycoside hydrolase [Candidatus Margulisiibacteriota bacterium]
MQKFWAGLLLFSLGLAFFNADKTVPAGNLPPPRPDKLYGIYVSVWTMNYPARCLPLLEQARAVSLNTLVCDFQEANAVYLKNFQRAGELGFYRIARIVVFEEGLGATYQTAADPVNWRQKLELSKAAEQLGFDEIQYDYIRFSDRGTPDPRKKEIIERFLSEAQA